jgi:large subunit ribosomal protein L9
MPKEVILMEPIDGLGAEGDVVKVADGYARNYLLPHKLAAPVTQATRRQLEKKRREREIQLADQRVGAEALAKTLAGTSCTIAVKTGEEGQLFGSVSPVDIVASLKEQGVDLDKNKVVLESPIRELGVFKLPVKLHPDVEATLKVWVVEE